MTLNSGGPRRDIAKWMRDIVSDEINANYNIPKYYDTFLLMLQKKVLSEGLLHMIHEMLVARQPREEEEEEEEH